ncbi:hypothetical protein [Pantoea rwandensis]|uniref:Anti-adapter protein IraP n=1 Tax=Pantoea rwandensis TaxID=1076550 RepID=A0ABM5RNW5_9GAMM|nr:hypothetical protein [Pantoea rwandensis]AIR87698.1 hypothetical protein LH22_20335 [Pantoea rwandensis]
MYHPVDDDGLTDIIIGEAVMIILEEKIPITRTALLLQLERILMTENDAKRKQATFSAISLVKDSLSESPPMRTSDKKDFLMALYADTMTRH